MKRIVVFGLMVMLALAIGQGSGRTVVAADDPHFGYSGEAGPEHWGSLSPTYATCLDGREQSPVDIPSSAPLNPASIKFNYQPSALVIGNNGHTIKVDYNQGSSIEVEGTTYNLVQFHFHARSEHALAGNYSPMELHLVHQSADGKLAVVGVLLTSGGEDAAYTPVLAHLPAHEGTPETIPGASINAAGLLPADQTYYRYNGSLTTPPCSEGVSWFVLRAPVQLSTAQIAAFTALYPNDARPVQSFNARTFLLSANLAPTVGMPRTGNADPAYSAALVFAALALLGTGLALARRPAPVAVHRNDNE